MNMLFRLFIARYMWPTIAKPTLSYRSTLWDPRGGVTDDTPFQWRQPRLRYNPINMSQLVALDRIGLNVSLIKLFLFVYYIACHLLVVVVCLRPETNHIIKVFLYGMIIDYYILVVVYASWRLYFYFYSGHFLQT